MVRLDGYSQPKEIGSLIVNGQGGDMAYSTQNTSCDSEDPKRYRIKDVRFPSCTLVAFLMLGLLFQTVQATDCTYRKDSLGNTRYQCDDGRSGTLRKDSLGNLRASDGTICRSNSLGYLRCDGQSTPPTLFEGE